MKKILLFCVAVLLCACAKQPPVERGPETQTQLDSRWLKFTALSAAVPAKPYRLQLSMRFGAKGDTRRVTALFWGNSERQLRLDVMAGVGAVVAKILEDGQHFLVYSPRENKGYFYQGASQPLLQVGVPVPFDLGHLADLLNGRYAAVFGESFAAASSLKDGLARYELPGEPGGSLDLNSQGLPVFWRESSGGGRGWSMEIAYDDGHPPLPRRLTLIHSNGKRAILLVKEREKPATAFTAEQMSLALPESAPLLPLAQYKN
ncbi:outer membrane lipoprotein LolB [Desulfovibrio sp. ZJ200]|uniref:outer membrane lipoprotein LolB n=1 Tax=Desulfovibrio sp. ZJ200 TaxID=2709792 RepID=UPI0013ECE5F9|nr:outer membrane lipoprotein LolB [Desulfovibrio sp. ZJ200]